MNDVQMLELSFRSFYEQAQELEAKGDFISARKAYLLAAQQMAKLAEANKGTELSKAQQGRAATILEHAQLVEEWAKKQREYLKNHPPAPRRPTNVGNEQGSAGSAGNSGSSEANEGGKEWVSAKKPDVTFDDVIGLEHAKREIFQNFIDPIRHPEVFRSYGLKGGKGLLLYGPPGTGKTTLAKAVAHEIDARFYYVRPSDLLSKWVGDSEKNLASLFEAANKPGPALIYMDDCEGLLRARDGSSPHDEKLMGEFLQQLDGFSGRKEDLFFLAATNVPWALDPAVLRGGRIDVKVYVGLPNYSARKEMIERFLNANKNGLSDGFSIDALIDESKGLGGGDIRSALDQAARDAAHRKIHGQGDGRIRMDEVLQTLRAAHGGRSKEETSPARYAQWGGFSLSDIDEGLQG